MKDKTKIFTAPEKGLAPAVALVNPKYGHNAAGVLRACSAFGMKQLWISGERCLDEWAARGRLPREERMKAYGNVEVCSCDYFYDAYDTASTRIVAVEVQKNAVPLTYFEHPDNALYVFGPEDGGLGSMHLAHCTDFVIIPSAHCLNLACAVNVVLAHRTMQRQLNGLEEVRPSYATLDEQRGFIDSDETLTSIGT